MAKVIIQKPVLPSDDLVLANVSQLINQAALQGVKFGAVDAIGVEARNLKIEESTLEKTILVQAKLEKLDLTDVKFKGCDLSAANCSEAGLRRVHFLGGRMTGVDFSRAALQDVVFEDCLLDMANFRFAKLTRVQFLNCQMTETDFQTAEMNNVWLEDSQLQKVEFAQAKLKNVDARGSQLVDIRGWQNLKGLKIDSTQLVGVAPQLALALGLEVQD